MFPRALFILIVFSFICFIFYFFKDYLSTNSLKTDAPVPKKANICTSVQFNEGRWVYEPLMLKKSTPDALEAAANYHSGMSYHHKCYKKKGEFARSAAMLDYRWEPSSCELAPVDIAAFSKHLADHPLLIIGDSVSELQFQSAKALLGEHIVNTRLPSHLTGGHPGMWRRESVHIDKVDVPEAVSLGFIRTDFFVRLDDFELFRPHDDAGLMVGQGFNFPWIHAVSRFDYIIINSGLHWRAHKQWGPNESREEALNAFTKAMRVAFDFLKENLKPHQRVWYRSTPFGHKSCSQYKTPSETPVLPPPDMYNWDMLSSFDEACKEMIEQENDPRFQFLNITYLTTLRPDAHSSPDEDCLHTCLPGPVDEWNKILFHEIARTNNLV